MGINEEKYNTVWTVLKFNRKKYRKRQTDIVTQKYMTSLSWYSHFNKNKWPS